MDGGLVGVTDSPQVVNEMEISSETKMDILQESERII